MEGKEGRVGEDTGDLIIYAFERGYESQMSQSSTTRRKRMILLGGGAYTKEEIIWTPILFGPTKKPA